jgi:peptidoglycan hydrolase-like protein with peptidoglycan-binding domain
MKCLVVILLLATPVNYRLDTSHGLISRAQHVLADQGYATPTDGIWSTATEQALRDYQQAHQLPVTGTLDNETSALMGLSHGASSQ